MTHKYLCGTFPAEEVDMINTTQHFTGQTKHELFPNIQPSCVYPTQLFIHRIDLKEFCHIWPKSEDLVISIKLKSTLTSSCFSFLLILRRNFSRGDPDMD